LDNTSEQLAKRLLKHALLTMNAMISQLILITSNASMDNVLAEPPLPVMQIQIACVVALLQALLDGQMEFHLVCLMVNA